MLVQDIHNIRKKHMLISYRREYQADAMISLNGDLARDFRIEFSLEMTPLGSSIVRVRFLDDIEYPLVPIMQELKETVTRMETAGTLPR